MDKAAFHKLTYGMYVVSSLRDGKPVGCIANTFAQVTSSPAQASIALNKENFTTQGVRETGAFEVVALAQSASMELIGTFGFHSSADTDKFAGFETAVSSQGIPYVTQQVCARFSVKVSQEVDLGSHVLFIGEVVDAAVLESEEPMTYAYYHQVKGGKTPPKAPSFNGAGEGLAESEQSENDPAAGRAFAWQCTICGHIEYVDELPDDFVCPICGVGRELFERIEL